MKSVAKSPRLSSVEEAKSGSRGLRGSITDSLAQADDGVERADAQILKFHGIYQQEDRDRRQAAKIAGGSRQQSFMVRTKIPGGVLTAAQYLAMDRLADDVVYNRSLRITTRQNFQLHGILKGDLAHAVRRVNDALLTTFCGCGDVERNIVAPPAPLADPAHRALRGLARTLTEALVPATSAYHEVWLDGARLSGAPEEDPIYGATYLPRKFKTGLALPDDNSVEVHDQDVGLVGIIENGDLRRLNVLVGGGTGFTHRRADTYARLGSPLGSVEAEHAVAIVRTIASIFRDFGDRADRRHARLKYVVEENGLDAFREEVRRRSDVPIDPWVDTGPLHSPDWLGPHEQGDGRFFYGLPIPSGRIIDDAYVRPKAAIAALVEQLEPDVILTPTQAILFGGLDGRDTERLERILTSYRVRLPNSLSPVRRTAMACPALPTCGLALAEAERVTPHILDDFETELRRLGRGDADLGVRVTGCPNSCARPYNTDIGLVGRKPDHYDIYVGGNPERLSELYAEAVAREEIIPTLRPLLEQWASASPAGESVGAFYHRLFWGGQRPDLLRGDKESLGVHRLEKASSHDGAVVSTPRIMHDESTGPPR